MSYILKFYLPGILLLVATTYVYKELPAIEESQSQKIEISESTEIDILDITSSELLDQPVVAQEKTFASNTESTIKESSLSHSWN